MAASPCGHGNSRFLLKGSLTSDDYKKSTAFLLTTFVSSSCHLHLPLQSFPVCPLPHKNLSLLPPCLLFEKIYSPRRPKSLAPWTARSRMGAERRLFGDGNSLRKRRPILRTRTTRDTVPAQRKRRQSKKSHCAAFSSLASQCDVHSPAGHPTSISGRRRQVFPLQCASQSTMPLGQKHLSAVLGGAATAIPGRRCFPHAMSTAD